MVEMVRGASAAAFTASGGAAKAPAGGKASAAIPQAPAEDAWEEAKKQAEDAFQTEDAEVKSLVEMMKEAREKAEEQKERFKIPNNTRYGDMPMEAYARLGRARTQAQASAAAGYARRQIARCQSALRQDPDNAARIRATIASLKKAAARAGKKRNELQQDAITESRRKKAAERRQRQKAQRLRRELCHRKVMRSIRESGYLRECEIDNRLQNQLDQTRTELRLQMQQLSSAVAGSVSPEAVARQYAAQSGAAAPITGDTASVSIEA